MGLGDSNSGQFLAQIWFTGTQHFLGGFGEPRKQFWVRRRFGLVPHSGVMIEHDMEKTCHDMSHDMTRYGMVLHDETRHDIV